MSFTNSKFHQILLHFIQANWCLFFLLLSCLDFSCCFCFSFFALLLKIFKLFPSNEQAGHFDFFIIFPLVTFIPPIFLESEIYKNTFILFYIKYISNFALTNYFCLKFSRIVSILQ